MALIRPRLTDFHNILLPQAEIDFAIPFLNEDLPLFVDPFLLWNSPSQQDQALHNLILGAFNQIVWLYFNGNEKVAIQLLDIGSECEEVGLGLSKTKKGKRIGENSANKLLEVLKVIPKFKSNSYEHFEEIQFYSEIISKDRISDLTCNFIKSFLIDYTIDQCEKHSIPLEKVSIANIYDGKKKKFISEDVSLPVSLENKNPIILVPKRWLRFTPWLNFDDFFKDYCPKNNILGPEEKPDRIKILNYNRKNYGVVENYIKLKERQKADCQNDPLFRQIPISSAKRYFKDIKKLPTGKDEGADRKYEDCVGNLISSLLYPHLDFAQMQSRTDSGVLIRDLIFYNNRSTDFLEEIIKNYNSRQIVMEMKNVKSIDRYHINQLRRYLTDDLGNFGVFLTRHPLSKAMFKNTIDLWSGHRCCIISLTDIDLEVMVDVFESKQRLPIEVIKSKYIDFRRSCPS